MKNIIVMLVVIAFAFFSSSMVFIQAPQVDGKKELYEKNCKRCHGVDGTKHFFGAKNLQISTLDSINTTRIIENGSGIMPAFREKLQVEEIAKISSYVKD